MENESPTLAKTINTAIEARLVDIHTCLPGVVEKYDATAKKADIKPALKKQYYKDAELVSLPVIPNVPMCFFQTKTALISLPIKVGDDVLIIFSERSLDYWKSSKGGTTVDPLDVRKFALSDAFAIPVAKPLDTGVPAEAEPIYIKNIDSEARFHEDGQIKHENPVAFIDIAANGQIKFKNQVAEITAEPSGKIESKNASSTITQESTGAINMTTPLAQIDIDVAGKVEVGTASATAINLGAGTEPVVKGTSANALYVAHTHQYIPGSGSPTQTEVPSNNLSGALSAKVKTE